MLTRENQRPAKQAFHGAAALKSGEQEAQNRANDLVDIAVRYCGGCNPYYNAQRALRQMEDALGMELQPCRGRIPRICVLFKQCKSDCFPAIEQLSTQKTLVITKEQDVADAVKIIRDLL